MKQKVIYLIMMLFSAIAMQAQVADYTITNVSTDPERPNENTWYREFRKLAITLTSVNGAEEANDLYLELQPVESQYLDYPKCMLQRQVIAAGETITQTFDFTEVFDRGNFTAGNHYRVNMYKGEKDQDVSEGFSGMTKIYTFEVYFSKEIQVVVADGSMFDSFSCSDCVDFRNANNTDVIAAYTVSYNPDTPNKVTLKRHKNVLPANTGVILYAPKATKSQSFYTVESPTATVDDENQMVAVTTGAYVNATNDGKFNYVVSEDKFSALLGPTFIEGGKAYLSIERNPAQNSGTFSIIYDPTGIDEVQEEKTLFGNGHLYTIQGQKAAYLQSGQIYICNGKKVLVK